MIGGGGGVRRWGKISNEKIINLILTTDLKFMLQHKLSGRYLFICVSYTVCRGAS